MKKILAVLLLIAAILTGCQAKYKVEYFDDFKNFLNAKKSYAPGEEVLFYYTVDVTDAYFEFSVDGQEYPATYENGKGYIFSFTMPEHDVKIGCRIVTIEGSYKDPYQVESLNELFDWPEKTVEELNLSDYQSPLGINLLVPINERIYDGIIELDKQTVKRVVIYINSDMLKPQDFIESLKTEFNGEPEKTENDPKESEKKHYYTSMENEKVKITVDEIQDLNIYKVLLEKPLLPEEV